MELCMNSRRLPQDEPLRQQMATVSNRPIRIGFIVNREIERKTLGQLFQYNVAIWGGQYNLFVPCDGTAIRDDWWQILVEYDPDYLVSVGEISNALVGDIYRKVQPFGVLKWDQFSEHYFGGTTKLDFIHNVSVNTLITHYFERMGQRPLDKSNVVYPNISETPYSSILSITFGSYFHSDLRDYYLHVYNATEIQCAPQSFQDYLQIYGELIQRYHPVRLTAEHINRTFVNSTWSYGIPLIITDGGIDDLFLFHILKWGALRGILIVPMQEIIKVENQNYLLEWYKNVQLQANFLTLFSSSYGLKTLQDLREKLRASLQSIFQNIDIWCCNFNAPYFESSSEEEQQQINIRNEFASCLVPKITFSASIRSSQEWITEVELSPHPLKATGFIPHKFSHLNYTLSRYPDEHHQLFFRFASQVRISRNCIATRVTTRSQLLSIYLPPADKLFLNTFRWDDYEIKKGEKGKYYYGMIKLTGGLKNFEFLKSRSFMNLFTDEFVSRGDALDIHARLPKIAKASGSVDEFYDTMQVLIEKSIFLRCFNVRCPECDYETWYDLEDVTERMICKGCRTLFQPPVKMNFSYRLNELFVRGIQQGAKTVLLTLMILEQLCEKSFIYDMGFNVSQSEKNIKDADLDVITICDGFLVIAECKDTLPESPDENESVLSQQSKTESMQKILTQFKQGVDIAREVNADFYIIATLDGMIPNEITQFIEQENSVDDQLRVQVFTSEDLLRGHIFDQEHDRRATIRSLKKEPIISLKNCGERDPFGDKGMFGRSGFF
jgi:hypothetical protein